MERVRGFQVGAKRYIIKSDVNLYKGRLSGLWLWDPKTQRHKSVSEKTIMEQYVERIEDMPHRTKEEEMLFMWRQGYSLKYIAENFCMSEEQVKKVLKD